MPSHFYRGRALEIDWAGQLEAVRACDADERGPIPVNAGGVRFHS